MIFTIVVLLIDWAVLQVNEQKILSYHSVYIAFLVLKLWRYKQPKQYVIREIKGQKHDIVTNNKKQNQKEPRYCLVCHAIKPDRYYHCRRCNKCIYLMDHHCNWVGNCIGQYNSKVYLHLLVNIFLHSIIILLITIYNYASLFDFQQYQIYYLIDFIPVLYSLYETHRLINDFWLSLKKNQTLIESYKNVHGQRVNMLANWQKHMGKSMIKWFSPTFQTQINCNLLEKVIYPEDEQVKEYDDPEDYIFGPLDEGEDEQFSKQQ